MTKRELARYEAPAITEFISIGWLQSVIARYIGWKVNRKWERYQYRCTRAAFLDSIKNNL